MPTKQTKRQETSFSHQADGLTWLEVFQLGKRPDSNGRITTITAADIDAANANYNVDRFRAPLIVSHDTKGVADHALADSELAYGYPERFKRIGEKVYAGFKKIVPQVVDWIKQGRIVDRSASFYLPESTTSPTPGTLAWRHIALLGRSNPACKGMAELNLDEVSQFSEELGLSETIASFSDDDPNDLVSVSCSEPKSEPESANPDPATAMSTVTRADLEELQSSFMAKLESLLPKPPDSKADPEPEPERTDMTEPKTKAKPEAPEKPEVDVTQYTEQITNLQQQLDAANAKIVELTPKPAPQPTAEELAQRAKTQKLEALIALQELDGLRSDVQSCISNNRERITPGLSNPISVSYTERCYNEEKFEFSEESKSVEWQLAGFMERVARGRTDRSDLEGFKTWLSKLPKQVDLSERSTMPNGDANPEPISAEELANKARALVEQKKQAGVSLSYSEALDQVIATENLAA